MRIIWTVGYSTSGDLSEIFKDKKGWSPSTIKTLLSRLCDKGFLKYHSVGRKNIYSSAIDEQQAYKISAMKLFDNICCMHYGETLYQVINQITLTKNDIKCLTEALNDKKYNAPDILKCNCLTEKDKNKVKNHN
jgi:BlaI family transcriptional regulator, penicillinase repressor